MEILIMNTCEWLHRIIESLPAIEYPFDLDRLPLNGIYFFYEHGEKSDHAGIKDRIVRIGTHKNNNFRSRINDHYLFNERKMDFAKSKAAPKDRSIFRKNIGRTILNKNNDDYLKIWNIDFTTRKNREKYGNFRNIEKEKEIEKKISEILRNEFYFRYIIIEDMQERMGSSGLESSIIGTVTQCSICRPSNNWFGKDSPIMEIKNSGLWQVQHLNSPGLNNQEKKAIENSISKASEIYKI